MGNDVKISCEINGTVCALYYLSRVYNVKFDGLMTLYEKYGKDVFYFFYLFCSRRLIFPSEQKLLEVITKSEDISSKLKDKDVDLKDVKAKAVYDYLNNLKRGNFLEFNFNNTFSPLDDVVDGINTEAVE